MGEDQVLAAGAALSAFSGQSQHNRLLRLDSLGAGKSLLVSVKEAARMFACKAGMKLVAASAYIDITALKDSVNVLAKLNITHTANRITITAKEEVVINGGTSFSRSNASGIVHGTSGVWQQHAAEHKVVPGKSEGAPSLPQTVKLPPGQLDLHHQYVNMEGGRTQGIRQGDFTVVDAEGGIHRGTLDGNGFVSASDVPIGMTTVNYGEDPPDPWNEDSYFGRGTAWPTTAPAGAGAEPAGTPERPAPKPKTNPSAMLTSAKAAAVNLNNAARKIREIAQATKQAAGAVQSLPKGGARALLAPDGRAGMASVVDKLAGAVAVLNSYGTSDPSASGSAPAGGMPGALPRIGTELPTQLLKKLVL